jgi:nitronate monooxygenase/enoyl-[acyl-carrier protein] reductase II
MGAPAKEIAVARSEGILWLQTVGDLEGAKQALDCGVDVLIAQGGEAGGNCGWVATMVLLPAVVDIAAGTPVVAAGGIADGRGVAAALALGAQGACLGTRFLASTEMSVDDTWQDRVVDAGADDVVKVENAAMVMTPSRPADLTPVCPEQPPHATE